jgi:hypothetical protein
MSNKIDLITYTARVLRCALAIYTLSQIKSIHHEISHSSQFDIAIRAFQLILCFVMFALLFKVSPLYL